MKESNKLVLGDFFMINANSAYRVVNSQNKYYVQNNPKYCSCSFFLEHAICKHYIAFCKLTNQQYAERDREFVCARKRGRPAKAKSALTK
jgi:predicted nucleic acid-binding Zn finger protein